MSSNETESLATKLVNVAYETFALKTPHLDMLGTGEWCSAGIENWAQIELSLGLKIHDFNPTLKGKKEKDCDILIRLNGEKYGIELRCLTHPDKEIVNNAIRDHPRADFYLSLLKTSKTVLDEIREKLGENFRFKNKMLNDEWMVMVVWRNKA